MGPNLATRERTALAATAVIMTGLTTVTCHALLGYTPTYDHAAWWNLGGSFTWWNVPVSAAWALMFGCLVSRDWKPWQREVELALQLIVAAFASWLLTALNASSMSALTFATLLVVLGISYGILEKRRLTGSMAVVFTSLVAGFAFGPLSFVVVLVALTIVAFLTAAALDHPSWASD